MNLLVQDIANINSLDVAERFFSSVASSEAIDRALVYTKNAHSSQKRKSGEPYVIHPILVASIVAKLGNDEAMIIAALLHDVVEDTAFSIEDIENNFGKDVSLLVEGLTKIITLRDKELAPSHSDEKLLKSALTFRKMLLASTVDVRVFIVKLCDRLHNMMTLDALDDNKRRRIAEETLVVYAPVAHRLGISMLKNLLEDLSFKYLHTSSYEQIESFKNSHSEIFETAMNSFVQELKNLMLKNGFEDGTFEILARVKHNYSIWLKMQRKGVDIDEILDLLAIKIIVKNPIMCYEVLGLVHLNFRPIASRFKDYIANPKENAYQTLHTTVFNENRVFEIQIRTEQMHDLAELGIISQLKNKKGEIDLNWISQLLVLDETEQHYMESLKNDLYSDEIVVYSPKAQRFTLPRHSLVIDFAYAVHSEIGDNSIDALVNKEQSSLLRELKNGDMVNIITGKVSQLRCSWKDLVQTSKAKAQIKLICNQRIRQIDKVTSMSILQTILDLNRPRIRRRLESLNILDKLEYVSTDINILKEVLERYINELRKNHRFLNFLNRHKFKLKRYYFDTLEVYSNSTISGSVFEYCCHPKIGDDIVAFKVGTKASVHHKMCQSAADKLSSHSPMVYVSWIKKYYIEYGLTVLLHSNKGALAQFLLYLSKLDINIVSIELGNEHSEATQYCTLLIQSKDENLNKLRIKLEKKIKVIQMSIKE